MAWYLPFTFPFNHINATFWNYINFPDINIEFIYVKGDQNNLNL